MRVFLTGATGFIGRKVALRLARDGHEVVAWVRDEARAAEVLGVEPELLPTTADDDALQAALAGCHAVINLAGSPVSRRFTDAVLHDIETSRVDVTRRLVDAIEALSNRPRVLVSASAVGWYGDRGAATLDESSSPGDGILAGLCERWERAAARAEDLGVRVALMRIGLVLGNDGGALPKAALAFGMGLGATLGSGAQMMPWIHVSDAVELLLRAVHEPAYRGPVNVTAPAPVSNREFTRELARAVRRPALLRAPSWLLHIGMGAAAKIVLAGADVRPSVALRNGFRFRFAEIDHALRDLLAPREEVEIERAENAPSAPYLRRRPPRYVLTTEMTVGAPLEEVFAFFKRAENLGALTPPTMSFRIQSPGPIRMAAGTRIRYQIKLGFVPLPWVTEIGTWDPPHAFSDAQLRGPYACWYHEHLFERDGNGGTRVIDRVWYAPPAGPLGAVANRLFIAPMLRRIFAHRAEAMRWRFGTQRARKAPTPAEPITRAAS